MVKKLTTRQILENNLNSTAPVSLRNTKIILHNIRSLYNVGSVFRSADAFGISEVILSGYTPAPPRAEITKTAIGAEEFVPWRHITDVDVLVSELKTGGYTFAGLEQTDESVPLPEFSIEDRDKLCLVMGNEVTGLDNDFLPHIDVFLNIPQFGRKHSLNVSVASAVALYALLEKSTNRTG